MQGKSELIKKRVGELLAEGKAQRVLGWIRGEFDWERTPAVFEAPEEFEANFIYDEFCGANLCKYLINACKKDGTTLILAKPCDTYGINMLIKEHRVPREKVYILGIGCSGKADINKLRDMGIRGITSVEDGEGDELTVHTLYGDKTVKKNDVKLMKCLTDGKRVHAVSDEIICDEGPNPDAVDRMAEVEKLEAMTPDERFAFWRGFHAASAATPAATYVPSAPAKSAFSTMRIPVSRPRRPRRILKKICSTSSVRSMLPDAAPTAASAHAYARSTYRSTF